MHVKNGLKYEKNMADAGKTKMVKAGIQME